MAPLRSKAAQAALVVSVLAAGGLASCASPRASRPGGPATGPGSPAASPVEAARGAPEPGTEQGRASWYGRKFQGRKTASGERFDLKKMTAAHRTLPFGTWVTVTHLRTGKSVRVRINDRGPVSHARVIDLSRAAAERIGLVREGTAEVRLSW